MKILFFLGHPAHYHLFKQVIRRLEKGSRRVLVVYKTKDVLEELLRDEDWECVNLQQTPRRDSRAALLLTMASRDIRFARLVRKVRPDLMVGTSVEITHASRLFGIPSLVVNEDDAEVVPLFCRSAYPFATHIVAPNCCSVGRWGEKKIGYDGYHELAYLPGAHIPPDPGRMASLRAGRRSYFLLRLSGLNAYHDGGRSGIHTSLALKLISLLEPHGSVHVTSEKKLGPELEQYRVRLHPREILDAVSGADLYIGDSQTMAAEAAILGVPSLRFNDFTGQIGYLEELEHIYNLTFGFRTTEQGQLLSCLKTLLAMPSRNEIWSRRRERMLAEKIDVAAFLVWLIENYPESVEETRHNPRWQEMFRTQGYPETLQKRVQNGVSNPLRSDSFR